jgi:hypothetical protein
VREGGPVDLVAIFSLAASLFSIALAIFAIWLALKQRGESAESYDKTKDVLGQLDSVMKKTETLVSENFQNLLKSITNQQGQMLEALKPRPDNQERITDLLIRLADDPEKLDRVVETIQKFNMAKSQPQASGDLLLQLLRLAQPPVLPDAVHPPGSITE